MGETIAIMFRIFKITMIGATFGFSQRLVKVSSGLIRVIIVGHKKTTTKRLINKISTKNHHYHLWVRKKFLIFLSENFGKAKNTSELFSGRILERKKKTNTSVLSGRFRVDFFVFNFSFQVTTCRKQSIHRIGGEWAPGGAHHPRAP